jgi:hypothetical protein
MNYKVAFFIILVIMTTLGFRPLLTGMLIIKIPKKVLVWEWSPAIMTEKNFPILPL